ncbi:MAG: sulfur carrier protein ThiS [Acidobacteriota bacterium]
MRVFVNGETKEFAEALKLDDLLRRLDMPPQRIAVELNRSVVRRKDWTETDIRENDKIEIVHFVGGG